MSDKGITLVWMNKLRERLEEEMYDGRNQKFKDNIFVKRFIEPILEYGISEEKRITESFNKN